MSLPPVPRDPARGVWLSHLGLLEDPFSNVPDSRFLYLTSQHGPILDRLHSIVERRRGLAIVDGRPALGKSILADRLYGFYRARWDEYHVGFLRRPEFDSEYTALLGLSTAHGLQPRKGIEKQWRELERFVQDEAEEGRVVLFVMDEAEGLNDAALTAVERVGRELAPAFLFGREQIQLTLAELPEVLGFATRLALTSLSLRDSIELVHFRCRVAGRDEPLFSDEALEFLWEAAYGVPGDLVELCNLAIIELRAQRADFVDIDLARAATESFVTFYGPILEGVGEVESGVEPVKEQ